jgi:hypothetical protein
MRDGDATGASALGTELRLRIKEELGRCDGGATPKVCGAISTLEGYLAIEAMVIGIVAQEGCAVGAAIANLEAELP